MKSAINIGKFFGTFFNKKGIYTGASFWYTPVLIVVLLFCKGVFFNLVKQQKEVQENIGSQRAMQSGLTLEFAKNQNHKKILDLQEKYFPHYVNISAANIIAEHEIENLNIVKNGKK